MEDRILNDIEESLHEIQVRFGREHISRRPLFDDLGTTVGGQIIFVGECIEKNFGLPSPNLGR